MARKDTAEKEVRKDAKLQNLVLQDAQAYEDLWRFRYPEEDGTKLSFEEILVEIPKLYGFTVSLSTLSDFYKWFRVKKAIDDEADFAEQFMADLAKNKSFTPTQVREAGQRLFTIKSIRAENAKVFTAMAALDQNDARLAQNEKRLRMMQDASKRDERKLALLEAKAKRLDDAQNAIASIQGNKDLTPEEQRKAVLDKMDEFFGLKKK